jgi:hypothetical protein
MKLISICSFFLLLTGVFLAHSSFAQEENEEHTNEATHEEGRHAIFLGFGWTHIPQGGNLEDAEASGFLVPTIGLDYLYKIAPKWEIGTMMDLELDHYLVVDQELERENAFIATVIGLYRVIPHLSVFAGAGIELEHHENLAIFRVGIDSPFYLKKGWVIVPSFAYDAKKGYDTWSLKISFGKEF